MAADICRVATSFYRDRIRLLIEKPQDWNRHAVVAGAILGLRWSASRWRSRSDTSSSKIGSTAISDRPVVPPGPERPRAARVA